ncbi:hypothetical protein Rsub_12690 [Raphidocelis subcapitata]|uniref:SAP domain-containing protein n=1 Tax=Raphidocelis subcapitata TaxID=307507 RepID=A0A2V0PJB6_9CHLO|nr:hypothetical protein Rsub_12690 [Raphidocelis subcapitata]|eukprot:GBF99894.1 hypothetical protein Rsub_12690 [Raphidocelis subcapitata]
MALARGMGTPGLCRRTPSLGSTGRLRPSPLRPSPRLPARRAPAAPAAARRRTAAPDDGGAGGGSDLEAQLLGVEYQRLLRLARARGVKLSGGKPTKGDVVGALVEAFAAEGVTQLTEEMLSSEPPPAAPRRARAAAAAPPPPPPPQSEPAAAAGAGRAAESAAADAAAGGVDAGEVFFELKRELAAFPYAQLVKSLKGRGLSAQGAAEALVERLARAVMAESAATNALPPPPRPATPGAAPRGAAAAAAPPPPPAGLPAGEREWLLADRQQQLLDELMDVPREELAAALEQAGEEVDPLETQEELAHRASWVLAAEEVDMLEARAAVPAAAPSAGRGAAAAAAPAAAPGGGPMGLFSGEKALLLDSLTPADVRMMKVKDLRDVLRTLGLSAEGGRYECRDRLLTVLAAHGAVKVGDKPALVLELSKMTLRELRDELRMRGASDEGTKGELERRLARAALAAAGHLTDAGDEPEAVTAASQAAAAASKHGVQLLLEPYDESTHAVLRTEPAATVALLFGGAPGEGAQVALESARALADALHTAPLLGAAAWGRRDGAGEAPGRGVAVEAYWVDPEGGAAWQVPLADLYSLQAPELALQLPAVAAGSWPDPAALARHLKSRGVTGAVASLPGGAAAAAAEALGREGVAVAGGAAGAAEDRWALLQRLQEAKFPTLPAILIEASDFGAAPAGGDAGGGKKRRATRRSKTVAADAAAAAAAGAQPQEGARRPAAALRDAARAAAAAALAAEAATTDAAAAAAEASVGAGGDAGAALAAAAGVAKDGPAADPATARMAEKLAEWCGVSGLDPEIQTFALSARGDTSSDPLIHACGAERAAVAARAMVDAGLPSVVIEPRHGQLLRWQVVVLGARQSGDPPAALMPAEVEFYHTPQEIMRQQLQLAERDMLQAGLPPEEIDRRLAVLAAQEPNPNFTTVPPLPRPLPGLTIKLHSPPRLSLKVIHTLRHAAAKAVQELGLNRPGAAVVVSGWADVDPDWRRRYARPDGYLEPFAADDEIAYGKLLAQDQADEAADPLPISTYIDPATDIADLSKFDPSRRCVRAANGEATVFVAGVSADAPLVRAGAALQQAAEVGLTPAALARHLLNAAAGPSGPQLPPPPPPVDAAQSFGRAHLTGATRPAHEVQAELEEWRQTGLLPIDKTDPAPWTRIELADEDLLEPLDPEQPFEHLVAVAQAIVNPHPLTQYSGWEGGEGVEEWQPEFDTRTQEDIHAARAATLGLDEEQSEAHRTVLGLWDRGLPAPRELVDKVYGPSVLPGGVPDDEAMGKEGEMEGRAVLGYAMAALPEPPGEEEDDGEEDRPTGLLARALGIPDPSASSDPRGATWGPGAEWDRLRDEGKGSPDGRLGADVPLLPPQPAGLGGEDDPVTDTQLPPGASLARLAEDGAAAAAAARRAVPASWEAAAEGAPRPPVVVDGPEALEAAVAAALARKPRVWVLMGGDGDERHASMAGGASVVAKLRRYPDLQVEPFLLPPADAGAGEARRRAVLLARGVDYATIGIPEQEWPEDMTRSEMLHMSPMAAPLRDRLVWGVHEAHLHRHSVEAALEAAEAAAAAGGTAYWGADAALRARKVAALDVQSELDNLYVEGIGTAWGSRPVSAPPPPRVASLEDWALEAAGCGAVVFIALHDSEQVGGELQALLEEAGVPFTGAGSEAAVRVADRLRLSEAVEAFAAAKEQQLRAAGEEEAAAGVLVPPKKLLQTDHLTDASEWADTCEELWQRLREGWEVGALAIKPLSGGSGVGVAKITGPGDLSIYGAAVREYAALIPSGLLASQSGDVVMPPRPGGQLLVEPWVDGDAVTASPGDGAGDGPRVEAAGASPWVEFTVGLIGGAGSLHAMAPSLVAASPSGGRVHVTPAPPHIIPPPAAAALRARATEVGEHLGLRGLAQLDGFVNAETGDVIVLDARAFPKLGDGHPLLQQAREAGFLVIIILPLLLLLLLLLLPLLLLGAALLESPPMLPHQLLRRQLALALEAAEADRAAAEAARLGVPAWYAAAAPGGGAAGGAAAGGDREEYDLDIGLGPGGLGGPSDEEGLEGDVAGDLAWTR